MRQRIKVGGDRSNVRRDITIVQIFQDCGFMPSWIFNSSNF